jgi:sialate O-acetylesterase
MKKVYTVFLAALMSVSLVHAELWMPAIFSDHMVLQREQANPVWGTAEPGQTVTVSIAGQRHETRADSEGNWRVELAPLPAGGPHELSVEAADRRAFEDVLVGEVWFCSGQSNMQWSVERSNAAAIEIASANHPEIRLISVPRKGTQVPQRDFKGAWEVCSPETVREFSAVGYFFGRRLHNALGVPVGLVDLSWGGSAAEAWVPREALEADPRYAEYLAENDREVDGYTDAVHAEKTAAWEEAVAAWEAEGREGRRPRAPRDPRYSNKRPGNIFNGVVHPVIGYGLRGNIWYQGESNTGREPQTYGHLFPLVIDTLRAEWGQGEFPFYWVQLADYREESPVPQDEGWARLRELQTMTLDAVENGGQAVIIDVGEGRDIHPRDKHTVANRLVRIALARDYGFDIPYQSPRFASLEVEGDRATVRFDHVTEQGLYAFDTTTVQGFAVAGEDRVFHWAEARIAGPDQDKVEVWSEAVPNPVAVRYAWGQNPVSNLYDREGLPVTPFRTDDW